MTQWPGLTFVRRDFFAHSASAQPKEWSNYDAVLDKGGAWDWMRSEAPEKIPQLLSAVKASMKPAGKYIVITRQDPMQLQARALESNFTLEGNYSLGDGQACAFILKPPL